jgi:hypothetical protein
MKEVDYIYFELRRLSNGKGFVTDPIMINENALIFKPDTNSVGYRGFTNMTERRSGQEYLIIDQYWVDLKKFHNSENNSELSKRVKECKEKLQEKWQKEIHLEIE